MPTLPAAPPTVFTPDTPSVLPFPPAGHPAPHVPDATAVATPRSDQEVADLVLAARRMGRPLAVVGRGHPSVGVLARRGAILVDLRGLSTIRDADRLGHWVDVTGGLECHALQAVLDALGTGRRSPLPANRLSVAAAVGAAGCDVTVDDGLARRIQSLRVVDARGRICDVAPESDPDWFHLLVGGHGLFGIVLSARIDLEHAPWPDPVQGRSVEADDAPRVLHDALEAGATRVAWRPALPFFGPAEAAAELPWDVSWGNAAPEPAGRPWRALLDARSFGGSPEGEAPVIWVSRRLVRVRVPRSEVRVYLRDVVRRSEDHGDGAPVIRIRAGDGAGRAPWCRADEGDAVVEVEPVSSTGSSGGWALGTALVRSAMALGGEPEIGCLSRLAPAERRLAMPDLESRMAAKASLDPEDRFQNDEYLALREALG